MSKRDLVDSNTIPSGRWQPLRCSSWASTRRRSCSNPVAPRLPLVVDHHRHRRWLRRLHTVALMIGGVTLLGVVTATLASWIVQRVAAEDTATEAATWTQIEEL